MDQDTTTNKKVWIPFVVIFVIVIVGVIIGVSLYFFVFKEEEIVCLEGEYRWSNNTCHLCAEDVADDQGQCPVCGSDQVILPNGKCANTCGSNQQLISGRCQCLSGYPYYNEDINVCTICPPNQFIQVGGTGCSPSTCIDPYSNVISEENDNYICGCNDTFSFKNGTCKCINDSDHILTDGKCHPCTQSYFYANPIDSSNTCHPCLFSESIGLNGACVSSCEQAFPNSQRQTAIVNGQTEFVCKCRDGYFNDNGICKVNESFFVPGQIQWNGGDFCIDSRGIDHDDAYVVTCLANDNPDILSQKYNFISRIRTKSKNQNDNSEYSYLYYGYHAGAAATDVFQYYSGDPNLNSEYREYWIFRPLGGNRYTISNYDQPNFYLSVKNGELHLVDYVDSWVLEDLYYLRQYGTNRYLSLVTNERYGTVKNKSDTSNNNIQLSVLNDSWMLIQSKENTSYCLDNKGTNTNNNTVNFYWSGCQPLNTNQQFTYQNEKLMVRNDYGQYATLPRSGSTVTNPTYITVGGINYDSNYQKWIINQGVPSYFPNASQFYFSWDGSVVSIVNHDVIDTKGVSVKNTYAMTGNTTTGFILTSQVPLDIAYVSILLQFTNNSPTLTNSHLVTFKVDNSSTDYSYEWKWNSSSNNWFTEIVSPSVTYLQ